MARSYGTLLEGVTTDPTLPIDPDWDADIGALASQILWLVSDKFRLTLSAGRIAAWADRSALLGSVAQSGTGRQPLFVQSAFNGLGGARFGYGRPDGFTCTQSLPVAGDFSVATVFSPSDQSADAQRLFYAGNATGSYFVIQITGDGRIQARIGDGTTFASVPTAAGFISTAVDPAAVYSVIVSYNYAAKRLSMSINGGAPLTATTAGIPDLASGLIRVGYDASQAFPFNGLLADLIALGVDVFSADNAGILALLKQYARDRYGLTIA